MPTNAPKGIVSTSSTRSQRQITETLAGSGRLAPPFVLTFGPSRRLLAHPPAQLGILSRLVLAHESCQAPSSVKRARYTPSST